MLRFGEGGADAPGCENIAWLGGVGLYLLAKLSDVHVHHTVDNRCFAQGIESAQELVAAEYFPRRSQEG